MIEIKHQIFSSLNIYEEIEEELNKNEESENIENECNKIKIVLKDSYDNTA